MRPTWLLLACLGIPVAGGTAGFDFASRAFAQVGEAGGITTRSDVRMSIEGASGTVGEKLDALAHALSAPFREVKSCYGELVKAHPDVVGELAVNIEVPDGNGPAKVSAPGAVKQFKPMQKCIDRAFAKLNVSAVPRPAGVHVLLTLTNSAAESVRDVKAQGEAAAHVAVDQRADGSVVSTGASLGNELTYRVSGKGPHGQAGVEQLIASVRDALPSFFDCRRRASKKASPEGDVTFRVKLSPTARGTVDSIGSTVANERAPTCLGNALRSALKPGGRGAVEVVVHFNP